MNQTPSQTPINREINAYICIYISIRFVEFHWLRKRFMQNNFRRNPRTVCREEGVSRAKEPRSKLLLGSGSNDSERTMWFFAERGVRRMSEDTWFESPSHSRWTIVSKFIKKLHLLKERSELVFELVLHRIQKLISLLPVHCRITVQSPRIVGSKLYKTPATRLSTDKNLQKALNQKVPSLCCVKKKSRSLVRSFPINRSPYSGYWLFLLCGKIKKIVSARFILDK